MLVLGGACVGEIDRLLRTHKCCEGIVYLAGREAAAGGVAVTAIAPAAVTTRGSFVTSSDDNAAVIGALALLRLQVIGQVHSHPGSWVDHSDGDDEGALVAYDGAWSIVVPDFARRGLYELAECGVHMFSKGCFRRLTVEAVRARVRIVPDSIDLREAVGAP